MLRRARKPTQIQIQIQGNRAFHLVHNLFTAHQNEHSAKQLATLTEKTYPSADTMPLSLTNTENGAVALTTLSQVLQSLEPLSYLEKGPRGYSIGTFPEPTPNTPIKSHKVSYKPWTRAGRGKEFHITTKCTPERFRHVLMTSYKYLLEGDRLELHLRQTTKDKQDHTVDWALSHCTHLRPDSILAAMPKGTTMLAKPATTDMSYKARIPKRVEAMKSQVMWAMENAEALKVARVRTPEHVKELASWSGRVHAAFKSAQTRKELAKLTKKKDSMVANGVAAKRIST